MKKTMIYISFRLFNSIVLDIGTRLKNVVSVTATGEYDHWQYQDLQTSADVDEDTEIENKVS